MPNFYDDKEKEEKKDIFNKIDSLSARFANMRAVSVQQNLM